MPSTKISAEFTGSEGSLGFVNGDNYVLDVVFNCSGSVKITHNRPGTMIGYQICEYQSFKSFLDNWGEIKNAR